MANFLLFVVFVAVVLIAAAAVLFYFLIFRPRKKHELSGALDLILYRITFPQDEITKPGEQKEKEPKDIMRAMEQLYAALTALHVSWWQALIYGRPYVAFEIALPHFGEQVIFYGAVPNVLGDFFDQQVHSLFPSAKVERIQDYNIFSADGYSGGSYLTLSRSHVLPLKTYGELEEDPLQVIVGAFSKLEREGEGAVVQVIVRPARTSLHGHGKEFVEKVRSGKSLDEIVGKSSGEFSAFGREVAQVISHKPGKEKDEEKSARQGDEELARALDAKATRPCFDVNIRLLASASSSERVSAVLKGLEGAFLQFNHPQMNSFKVRDLATRAMNEMIYKYSFRVFDDRYSIYLSSEELAGIYHFPYGGFAAHNVMYLEAREAPLPVDMPYEGLLLGNNVFRGRQAPVYMADDDRRRHMYVIGQTGTGKTNFLKNLIRQDIETGKGVCFIDPHGDDVEDVLSFIPKERAEDVIYFNPGDVSRPLGMNFLEYDLRFPEQKTFVVNELFGIFQKLYSALPESLGPMFEQYFRNSTLLVIEDPSSGNTLLEIGRVMVDKEFRDYKLSRSANIVVNTFWKKIAEKAGGEAKLENMVPYITSKFDTFLANEIMRPIIAQEKSAFNFRDVMDKRKILLINLSKGRLGELNSNLLGLVVVGKILMAAFSRVDIPMSERNDFYLYIDEFQNVTTNSIATILSEARKYKLNLVIAHQFLGQLDEDIKKAVFGNVGTVVSFRIGADDGEFMEKQFSPVFGASDLMKIENYRAYVKMLLHGETARPFNLSALPPKKGNSELARLVKELSRTKYGRPREEVEAAIRRRYNA